MYTKHSVFQIKTHNIIKGRKLLFRNKLKDFVQTICGGYGSQNTGTVPPLYGHRNSLGQVESRSLFPSHFFHFCPYFLNQFISLPSPGPKRFYRNWDKIIILFQIFVFCDFCTLTRFCCILIVVFIASCITSN